MRTLIIGDIHGCYDELLELFDVAALADGDTVVSVGDVVDRGPKPAEVVAWFRARPGALVLMGNHERKHVRQVFSYSQEITRLQLGEGYAESVEWMRGLPYFYETPEVRVVHAAMIPGIPLAEQPEHVLAGTTSGEAELRARWPEGGWWHERYSDAVPVVFGHHVVGPEPLVREGRVYGIDTGACHGLRLTALSVPDLRLYSVPARADHWAQTARAFQVAVLRTRPWRTMSWKKIDEKLADFREDGESAPYLDEIATWAATVRALQPRLLAEVATIAERMGSDAAAYDAHPAKALLYMHARGRLDVDAIAKRCTSPAATLELAAKLGVDVGALTAVP